MIRLAEPATEYLALRDSIDAAVREVLGGGGYILGRTVERFEADAASYLGARHAIGVSNGTDALVVALAALDVGPGDEVVVPAFTFIATAGPVARVGARPVFADVDPTTFLVPREELSRRCGPRTRAVVTVHLFGRTAPSTLSSPVPVVEDAAQAFGAGPEGRRAGTVGRFGAYSFFPAKPFGACGDAGLLVTADPALADRARRLRAHGAVGKNVHAEVGGNYRLDALQAAILSVKLRALDGWLAARQRNADALRERIGDVAEITLPTNDPEGRHTWAQFVVRATDRDRLAKSLADAGIQTAVYYPVPLPYQPCFESLGHRPGEFPGAEEASRTALALPVHAMLSEEDLDRVGAAVRAAYGYATR